MEKDALEQLRDALREKGLYRFGAMKRIAEKTGSSKEWIRMVLKGKYMSEAVINAALEVVEELKIYKAEQEQAKAARDQRVSDKIIAAIN